jgi:lysocardiolipin and lysophospholipid acyltransferase
MQALLECLLGIRVVITGDAIRANEASLLLMNHRTRLDWMYLWSVLLRQSGVKMEKIILKTPLKLIPGAGWAMQVGAFLFINRCWEEDRIILDKMLDYFADIGHKTQVGAGSCCVLRPTCVRLKCFYCTRKCAISNAWCPISS